MAVNPGIWVPAPAVTPVTGGLLSVAPPADITDPHAAQGISYRSELAGAGGFVVPDPDDCNAPTQEKLTGGFDDVHGEPFDIQWGVECKPVGDNSDYLAIAGRNLEFNEGYLVEQKMWSRLAAAATDLRPAGAVKPKVALGLLSEYAGVQYRGVPVLHFGRRAGAFLIGEQLVKQDESAAAAAGGALYANGAGYTALAGPGGVAATAETEAWLYMTGQVNLWRLPIIANETFDPINNTALAIAERTFIASVESFVVGIRVSLE